MANPALNERTFSPERVVRVGGDTGARARVRSIDGTIARSLVLLVIVIATGTIG